MPNEHRVRADAVQGALSASLAAGATTMESAALADLLAIGATEHAYLSLYAADSAGRITKRETVRVTAHAAGATTATVERAQDGTADQAWVSGSYWLHAAFTRDLPRVRRQVADQSTSLTSLSDITDLWTPIAAFEVISFEAYIFFLAAGTTTGLRLGVNGPSSPTAVILAATVPLTGTAVQFGGASAYGQVVMGATTPSTSVPYVAQLYGTIENGANAGNVAIQFGARGGGQHHGQAGFLPHRSAVAVAEVLTAEQRTVEGPGAVEWEGVINATVERDTSQFYEGTASLKVTAVAAGGDEPRRHLR